MGEQHANGWRVSRHRLVADATVGVIANPMSGRDIRRLVASASVFPNAEKASMVVRAEPGRLPSMWLISAIACSHAGFASLSSQPSASSSA